MSTLAQIARFIRWRDWGPGKLTLIWGLCLYIAVAYDLSFETFSLTFLVFMPFAATQAALGYVLNNWGDRELDRRQFKNNPFNGKTYLERVLSLTLVLVAALVTGLPFILRPGFALLWLVWAIAADAYSLEPLRLKTRGLVGLVVAIATQWFLPVLIVFAAFQVAGHLDMWVLAGSLSVSGAMIEVGHQRFARSRNMLTKAGTFAAGLSDKAINRIYTIALVLDKLSIGAALGVFIAVLFADHTFWPSTLGVFLGVMYGALLPVTLTKAIQAARRSERNDPYDPHNRSVTSLLHETLLNFAAPVALGITAMTRSPLYGSVLGVFLVWRVLSSEFTWRWALESIRVRPGK